MEVFFNDVWFTTILIGWNQLRLIVDKFIGDFLDLKNKIFF